MAHWNPRQFLDVYPQQSGFTCVGTTKQGLRCRQSFLANVHKAEADRILDSLPQPEQFRTRFRELYPTLRRLAWLTLCPRWHQDGEKNGARGQANTVASRWMQIINVAHVPFTPAYSSYQAPVALPLSPPQSPPRQVQSIVPAAISLPTHSTRNARTAAPPATPPLSSSQHTSESGSRYADRASGASTGPQVSSSMQTTQNNGSTRIDINVTVIIDQLAPMIMTPVSSRNSLRSSTTNRRARSPAPPNDTSVGRVSRHDSPSPSSVATQSITRRDLQDILDRLGYLERQAAQLLNGSHSASSRPSRSTSRASNSTATNPRSTVESVVSELRLPPPIGQDLLHLAFPVPRSPPPAPHAGSLSISSDSIPSSPIVTFSTPSSPGFSTPVMLSPLGSPAALPVAEPRPVLRPVVVQRRPIEGETCYVCDTNFDGPADAVWCRGTCGQNVCIHCFDRWVGAQDGRIITCPFCRQPWVF